MSNLFAILLTQWGLLTPISCHIQRLEMIIGLVVCFENGNSISDVGYMVIFSFAHTHTPRLMSFAIVLVSDLHYPALLY